MSTIYWSVFFSPLAIYLERRPVLSPLDTCACGPFLMLLMTTYLAFL